MTQKSKFSAESDSALGPWPFYDDDEISAAARVLRSGNVNYWTGEEGRKFESEYAAHCGVSHGLAVANGTAALELALQGLEIGPGDEVVVPARTFIATAAAVASRGAIPVVADVDTTSQNLTAETVAEVLSPRTRAIVPVHLAGWPVDMPPLLKLARQKSLLVIEDCAQAHGATINGKPVGSFGDVGCFSFCQDKIITTAGEGGMAVTNDNNVFQRMWSQRDHGKNFELSRDIKNVPGFKWLVTSFGTNWRLTEPQSAIGRLQLRKLPQWTKMRRANAATLDEVFAALDAVSILTPPPHLGHAYYKYCGLIDPAALKEGWSRDRICDALNKKHIPIRVGACPDVSKEQAFKAAFGAQPGHPNAESIADRSFILPVHPTLSAGNMRFIADTVHEVILSATR